MMFAVAVLGLLSAISTAEYAKYALRTKRMEGYSGLANLRTLESTYFIDNERYTDDFTKLEFVINAGVQTGPTTYQGKKYVYDLTQPWGVKSWYCTASANLDGDPWPDVLAAWDLIN